MSDPLRPREGLRYQALAAPAAPGVEWDACADCGVFVASRRIHDDWHDRQEPDDYAGE